MSTQNSNAVPSGRGFNLWTELFGNLQLVYQLMRDPRVNKALKIVLPVVVAAYILSPVDFIPDFIPIVGELDDVALILLAARLFIQLAPPEIVNEYRSGTGSAAQSTATEQDAETVDTTYRVVR